MPLDVSDIAIIRRIGEDLPRAPVVVALVPAEEASARRAAHARLTARRLGLADEEIALAADPAGRPVLLGREGVFLSRAARDGLAALCVADRPVGVDLERATPGEVPWNVLLPGEARLLERLGPQAFPSLWTVKEAALKALGLGFLKGPEAVMVGRDADGRWTASDAAGRRTLQVVLVQPDPGWTLAVVTADGPSVTSPD